MMWRSSTSPSSSYALIIAAPHLPPPKTTWLDSELLHQLCASRGSPYTRGDLRRPVKIAFQLSCTIRTSQISQHAESIPLAFQLQKNTLLPPLKLSDTMGFCCLVAQETFGVCVCGTGHNPDGPLEDSLPEDWSGVSVTFPLHRQM